MQISYNIVNTAYGRTLITMEDIPTNRVIWTYDDSVQTKCLTLSEIQSLPVAERDMFETYCWQVTDTTWEGVTEYPESDPLNFIDHSCNPNMVFQGDDRLVAFCDIKKGEPLTLEYATCDTTYAEIEHCHCGSPFCRKKITSRDAYNAAIRIKYAGRMRSCIANLL